MLAGLLALIAAALFTGAAIYINVAEQPARLALDDRALLTEWKRAYLATAGFLLGIVAARSQFEWRWFAGALVFLTNWPFTLIVILPTNKLLMEIEPRNAGSESRELIKKWGRLHAVRSALGATAAVLFLWAALQ